MSIETLLGRSRNIEWSERSHVTRRSATLVNAVVSTPNLGPYHEETSLVQSLLALETLDAATRTIHRAQDTHTPCCAPGIYSASSYSTRSECDHRRCKSRRSLLWRMERRPILYCVRPVFSLVELAFLFPRRCQLRPDPDLAHNGSWRDATRNFGTPVSIGYTFTGLPYSGLDCSLADRLSYAGTDLYIFGITADVVCLSWLTAMESKTHRSSSFTETPLQMSAWCSISTA